MFVIPNERHWYVAHHEVRTLTLSHLAWFELEASSETLLHKLRWATGQPLDPFGDWGMRRKQASEIHPQQRLDNK